MSYADFAASIGLQAVTVTDPDDLGAAWDAALAADRPTVLDVHTSADVPPIPPHATLEQIRNSAQALFKGDEDRVGVISTGVKEKLQEFIPGKRS
jgi:pyruvate dehydrogenase (quinone)